MNSKIFIAIACLAAVSLGAADRPLMDSGRWCMPESGGAWVENEKAIQLTVPENVEPAKADIRATLPVKINQYAGKSILLAAEVRGEEISAGGKRWFGGKIILSVRNAATGVDENPTLFVPERGTFGWKKVSLKITLPAAIRSATLKCCLSSVSGTFLVRNITITPVPDGVEAK